MVLWLRRRRSRSLNDGGEEILVERVKLMKTQKLVLAVAAIMSSNPPSDPVDMLQDWRPVRIMLYSDSPACMQAQINTHTPVDED